MYVYCKNYAIRKSKPQAAEIKGVSGEHITKQSPVCSKVLETSADSSSCLNNYQGQMCSLRKSDLLTHKDDGTSELWSI